MHCLSVGAVLFQMLTVGFRFCCCGHFLGSTRAFWGSAAQGLILDEHLVLHYSDSISCIVQVMRALRPAGCGRCG